MTIVTNKQVLFLAFAIVCTAPTYAQVPLGTFLDVAKIREQLTQGWQKKLHTTDDPANKNQWNTHDGGNGFKPGGLHGLITERKLETKFLDPIQYPVTRRLANSSIIANPSQTDPLRAPVTLTDTSTASVTDSSTVSDALKSSVEFNFSVTAGVPGASATSAVKLGMDYTRTKSTANSQTLSKAAAFSQTLDIIVPAGKTYMAVLEATDQTVDYPYRIDIMLEGMSSTWFENRVNGHYNHTAGVGQVIREISPSGYSFPADAQVLIAGVSGVLRSQRAVEFSSTYYDITGTAAARQMGGQSKMAVPAGAKKISLTPLQN